MIPGAELGSGAAGSIFTSFATDGCLCAVSSDVSKRAPELVRALAARCAPAPGGPRPVRVPAT